MSQTQNVIAVVYDYDRTLSPGVMHDDVIFPEIGVESDKFWRDVDSIRQKGAYENELAWIRLLLEQPEFRRLSNADLSRFGRKLQFFPEFRKCLASWIRYWGTLSMLATASHWNTTLSPQVSRQSSWGAP